MADENPLLKALPPETDYISYLTILEYNLTAEQLPTLHRILQDTTLTANIGWDLVHLLLPLLPASAQCLQDVARLGNPREVVLKATELLEAIGEEQEEEQDVEDTEEGETADTREETQKLKELGIVDNEADEDSSDKGTGGTAHDDDDAARTSTNVEEPSKSSSKMHKFTALLEMLSILHPRIKTRFPSRFLSTSLQAVLPAYSQVARQPEATEAVLGLIKTLSGTKRPKLPPRKSSSMVSVPKAPDSAPDPEGQDDALGVDEAGLQRRLLQSFLTFVAEGYMLSTTREEYVSGLAWSQRYQEKLRPEKTIPGTTTATSLFENDETLHERDATTGHILALVRDLKMDPQELVSAATKPEEEEKEGDQELPSSASEVALSRMGSLYLLATIAASSVLFDAPASLPPLNFLPEFTAIVNNFLGDPSMGGIGMEPEPLVDTILFLGFVITNTQQIFISDSTVEQELVTTKDDEGFTPVLQRLSLLSANMPSPSMRYNAHLLTSSILHSHPSHDLRFSFIRDTLEHCPYENLKASAIGWLKDELLAATTDPERVANKEAMLPDIFANEDALTELAPFIFVNVDTLMEGRSTSDSYEAFIAHQPFYLAVLNLLYLLLLSPTLYSDLEMAELVEEYGHTKFLDPLLNASKKFREKIMTGELGYDGREEADVAMAGSKYREEKTMELAPLKLLGMTVEEVIGAMAKHDISDLAETGDEGQGSHDDRPMMDLR